MQPFRFIHAADLHLGSPFRGLALKDGALARVFSEASRRAFGRLVDAALQKSVDFMVIAGDIYDGDWKDNSIGLFFNREVSRLGRAGIPVYFLRGNHDAESVITRAVPLPEAVREFSTASPETFRLEHLKVALHGQGFAERAVTSNLALSYPAALEGWFNIGVLHTSLTGRELHAPYAPASLAELKSRGYDYWALGHVHEYEVVSEAPLVVFPGNLQGRSIVEPGAKGAVLVEVADGVIHHERLIVDEARFLAVDVPVEEDLGWEGILERARGVIDPLALALEGRVTALRIRLSGASAVRKTISARRAQFHDELQAICHHCHQDLVIEKIELRLVEPVEALTSSAIPGLQALLDEPGALDIDEQEALALVREIANKLPDGSGARDNPLDVDITSLIEEARALLATSAGEKG